MNFTKALTAAALALCGLVTSCASTPLNTPSGKPEIFLPGASRKQALDVLANRMLTAGYRIGTVNSYGATFHKASENTMANVLFGSRYDAIPEVRVQVTTIDTNGGVRVVGDVAMITNPGSAFERRSDLSRGSKAAHEFQAVFEQIRAEFSRQRVHAAVSDSVSQHRSTPKTTPTSAPPVWTGEPD